MSKESDIRKFYPPRDRESLTRDREENYNVEGEAVGHETEPTGAGQPRKRRQITKSLTAEEIERQLIESSQDSQDPDSDLLAEDLLKNMDVDNLEVDALLAEQEADEEGLDISVVSQASQPEPEPEPQAGPSSATARPRASGDSISAEDAERGLKVLQECLAGLGG